MIRKTLRSVAWYEFELLQPYPFLAHGTCLSPITPPQMPSQEQHPFFASGGAAAMNQVHGSHVVRVSSPGIPQLPADAMVTALPNLALVVKHADCQPCLLFDPEHTVIGAVHSGWKGSCLNIYKATVEYMQSQFNTNPEQLIACIGPSLGPCHAEFINWRDELPASFEPFRCQDSHFDFWAISRHQLQACGLAPEHIEIAKICTVCRSDLFCSYRFNATQARNISFVAVKPRPLTSHPTLL